MNDVMILLLFIAFAMGRVDLMLSCFFYSNSFVADNDIVIGLSCAKK